MAMLVVPRTPPVTGTSLIWQGGFRYVVHNSVIPVPDVQTCLEPTRLWQR